MNVEINRVITAYPRTSVPRGAPVPVHVRRRRRLAALATTAVAAATLQTALAPPAEAGQVGVTISIQGAGTVTVVEGSLEDNGPTVCDWTSNQDHRVTRTCTRIRNEETFEAWVWLRAEPAPTPAGHWAWSGWTGCQQLRERNGATECAVHSGAFTSDERTPTAHFTDRVAPRITQADAAQTGTTDRYFTFTFAADEGSLQCRLRSEEKPFAPCTSPVERTVAWGADQFQVRAVDPSGNIGTVRNIDVVGVDTFIFPGPLSETNDRTAEFGIDSVEGADVFCSVDQADWMPCGTGPRNTVVLSDLSEGRHLFQVFARHGRFLDPVPARYAWTVDTTAPVTSLTEQVDGRSARFTFSSPGSVRHECRLVGPGAPGSWSTCTSPVQHHDLADGDYAFEVRSWDAATNVEDPPARHAWRVDGATPDTTATGPSGFVLSDSATVGLRASESGARFTCTLDGAAKACGPTALTLRGLSRTTHVVTAAARDAAGNTDPTPAVRTWTVPLTAGDLTRGAGWRLKRSRAAYGGAYLQTKRKGASLTRDVAGARAVALVVGKGRKHGKVKVYAGSRLVGSVRLAARGGSSKQLVRVASFAAPYTGPLRVVVATTGRPVRIEGLGVATR